MKIGVLKLGARITVGGTSGGSGEALSICKMLAFGGAETHIFTKILKKDTLSPLFKWHQILEEAENINNLNLDALIVVNGSINYMGGAPADEATINYLIINKFKGPVFYIYCDPNLPMRQIWGTVEGKNETWKSKYGARTWSQNEIDIKREDIFVICQSYNTEHAASQFKKNSPKIRGITNYPFDKFPLLSEAPSILLEPVVDLSYGGTMRGGKREKKLIDFYFDYPEDISVEVFGKISEGAFTKSKIDGMIQPKFSSAVAYNKMISKMSEARAHVVIGDEAYVKFDIMSQRTYESVLAGCVTFIDSSLDQHKRMYGTNKDLADFLYVSNRNDVIDKIRILKNEPFEFGRQIAEDTLRHFNFNRDEFCRGLVETIKANM